MGQVIPLALALLANVAALVAIAAWYRRDRSDLITDRDAATAETKRLRTMLASAEADAHNAAEWAELETEVARFRAEAAETALAFHALRADGVIPIEAARLARGRR